jgi:hypothetical protein
MKKLYLIGSLRNPAIPVIASALRNAGFDVFDDWYAAGPNADDCWRDYEKFRGHSFTEALQGYAAQHVFQFDLHHLKTADLVVLALPAGKSGHMELGWALGRGTPGYIILDSPERWDCMYAFATDVYGSVEDFIESVRA